jgi:hypothetical protein
LILITFLSTAVHSKKKYPQEDRKAWFGAKIEYSVTKDIELSLSEELRYYNNRGTLEQSLTDLGVDYKFTDWFKSGIFTRYRKIPDEGEEQFETYLNLSFKYEIYNIELSDRVRLHFKFRENKESVNNFRNKLTLGYKALDWLEPYIAAELFYRFLYDEGDRLSQGRYYIGTKIILSGEHEFDLFLMREQEYNTSKAIHSNVIGLEYNLSF